MNQISPYDFTIGSTRCRVVEIDYQRNGVAGAGFFVLRVLSSDAPERPLIAVLFDSADEESPDESAYTAVVDPSDLGSHWRGDRFHAGCLAAVKARYDEVFPALV